MANIISSVDGILNVYDDGTIDIVGGTLHIDGTEVLAGGNSATFTSLSVDSPTLVVDAVNNRVGIGTTDPETKLEVWGNARIGTNSGSYLEIGDTTGANYRLSTGSYDLSFSKYDADAATFVTALQIQGASANDGSPNVRVTNDLTVGGNLTVEGTTTTLNTATLDVEDLNITLASGAANAAAADGAGLTVAGASATLLYKSTADAWSFNKAVGIGTTDPDDGTAYGTTPLLHVYNNTASTNPSIVVSAENNDEASLILGENSSNLGYAARLYYEGNGNNFFNISIADAGTEHSPAFTIDRYDNVGIGTITPGSKLHVHGTGTDGQEILEVTSNGNVVTGGYHWMTTATAGSQTNTNSTMIMYVGQALSNKNGGYLGFNYQGASSNASFLTLGGYQSDKLLNIRMDGKVGIGTTNPGGHLDVRVSTTGNLLSRVWNSDSSGTGSSTVRIANSGNNAQGSRLEFSDSAYYVGTITGDRTNGMQFYSGQMNSPTTSLRMTLDINGNLGIGVAPTHDLTVKSDIAQISPDGTNTITQRMTDADVLSWSGDSGQLFSISDNLTGTIFSVNDVSGIPSLEVDDDGTVRISETFGNVLIGTNVDDGSKLKVNGTTYLEDDWNRINVGNTNNTSSADTIGLHLHNTSGTYSNGQHTHRLRKYDHGGGVPLYIDYAASTANTFTALARFGTYTGNNYEFEVFGDVKATTFTGSLTGNVTGNATSATNADTVDNLHATSFLRSDTSDVMTFNTSGAEMLKFANNTSGGYIQLGFQQNDTDGMHHRLYIKAYKSAAGNAAGKVDFIVRGVGGSNTSDIFALEAGADATWQGNKIWTAGNDGGGSGLDADKLDGLQSSSFLRSDADDTTTGSLTISRAWNSANTGGQIYMNGSTGNRIEMNGNGVAGPAFTTRSAGAKFVLYPEMGASSTDYAIGIESNTMWFSTPRNDSARYFRWYHGTTNTMTLENGGNLSMTGTLSNSTGGGTMRGKFIGDITSSGNGQSNAPFVFSNDYSGYMVGAAGGTSTPTWGLFWAGNSGALYGTNGNGGPGDIWSNSSNPNEFVFVGNNSTQWTVYGNNGNVWQNGSLTLNNSIYFSAKTATTTNQNFGLYWDASDKETTTDGTDSAFIRHTVNTGGIAGSVLQLSSQNDSNDGIAFTTHASSPLKHNSKNLPRMNVSDGAPSSNITGDLWYESDSGTLYVYYDSFWVDVAPQLGVDSTPQFNSLGVGTPASGTTGEIRATNDVTAYYSDERLKTFEGKIPNAVDRVKQLNGYYFRENEVAEELGYKNKKRQVGVSAQEVEKVLPEVVTEAPISSKYKAVKYDKMIPLLIEAIKEQQEMIDDLKSEINKLKGNA